MENPEEMKKCYQCLADIPKKARKCSKCGSKQPNRVYKIIAIFFAVVFFLPVFMTMFSDDTSTTKTTVVQKSSFELGMYKVQSDEFQYIESRTVNIWKSFSDRTLIGKINQGDVVEVTRHDPMNDYCRIKTENITGWVACGWLIKDK
jgi:predicted nucleic acid-binding Zn ribbon protein